MAATDAATLGEANANGRGQMAEQTRSAPGRPSVGEYLAISAVIGGAVALDVAAMGRAAAPVENREIVLPMLAMFAVTAVVWVLMVLFRNLAVLLGAVSVNYFCRMQGEAPSEWIERPAGVFNNSMQVPVLFYIVALLMISFNRVDLVQLSLAWIFIAFRVLHAAIYLLFNYVPLRFAAYAASCITLAAMWGRFAASY